MLRLLFALLSCSGSDSLGATLKKFGDQETMNGYSVKDLGDFPKNWHLVTVRFRRDTQEMRFTYANETAWKAMNGAKLSYPDGSMFAKVGVVSEDDPAFVSSVVPSKARRYQLMVKNSTKHRATDSWGYALFNEKGLTYDEDPKLQEQACAACHRLVANRNFVFSQRLDLTPRFLPSTEATWATALKFKLLAFDKIPKVLRAVLGDAHKQIYLVDGPLTEVVFQGTLDEIRPALEKKSVESGVPAALLSSKGERYSLIIPEMKSSKQLCKSEKEILLKSIVSARGKGGSIETTFCYAR